MKEIEESNWNKILVKVSNGDQHSFGILYGQYSELLRRFSLPFVGFNDSDAEEVVQEIFLKVWIKRSYLASVKNFQSYLFQMAKNHIYDIHKNRKAEILALAKDHEKIKSTYHSSYQELLYQEYYASAQSIIDQLSPQRKRIFEMRTKEGLNLDEIAKQLKISKSGVKKQLYEAKDFVKSCLKKEQDMILIYLLISVLI
ncbi:RNA polymerase sigma factor [Membranihabitans marinus]|uniref:RNA polymerase sigma factor n=1 Tax=Membranihabitans marinus TaxID=1227546 RepID=UPI001F357752|nr:RNA polymerase sigma factor [Membranihabitans marinus]